MKFTGIKVRFQDHLLLFVLSAICFLPFLGSVPLFDWDEINFAESAREMLLTGNFLDVQINFQPFYEKPPLFFWFQAACMKLFGVNEWAARLPNALTGFASLILLYNLGIKLKDRTLAWIFISLCVSSLLPNLYFRTGIIDPFFNLLILSGLYFFLLFTLENQKNTFAILSGLLCGLAVLAKGPVAILFYSLVIGLYIIRFKPLHFVRFTIWASISGLLPLLTWYGMLTWLRGSDFIIQFLIYQIELFTQPVAGHNQPWFYHILVLLAFGFPFSWLYIRASIYAPIDYAQNRTHFLFKTLFILVLIIFSISTTKIVHYSSLAWLPGCIVVGIWLREQMVFLGKIKLPEWTIGIGITGFILGITLMMAGWILPELGKFPNIIQDKFFLAGLTGPVHWTRFEWLPGLFLAISSILLLIIRKKVYNSSKDFLKLLGVQAFLVTVFLHLTAGLLVPRISEINQGPALELYKSLQNKKVHIIAEGYKSYAPYFYARTTPPDRPELNDKEWLIRGAIDRPVWMVTRVDRINPELENLFINFKKVKQSGGFAFYLRMP